MHGYGIIYFHDNRVYTGQWIYSKMHGYGEFYWPDGRKYIGFYKNDKKDGFGIFYWPGSKKAYIGSWKDGQQNGVGYIVTNSAMLYGIWKDGHNVKYFEKPGQAFKYFKDEETHYIKAFKYNLKDALDLAKM